MSTTFRALVSAVLLVAALWLLDWTRLFAVLVEIHPATFSLGVVITCLILLVLALRWWLMLARYASLPAAEVISQYYYASFMNTFTPAGLGGDTYRFLAMRRTIEAAAPRFTLLVRERLLGLVGYLGGFLICLGIAITASPGLLAAGGGVFAVSAVLSIAAIGLVFTAGPVVGIIRRSLATNGVDPAPGHFRQRLDRFFSVLQEGADFGSGRACAGLLGLSFLGVAMWVGVVALVASEVDLGLSFATLGAVVLLVELVRMIPVSVQGIGVREGAFAYLVACAGGSPETGFVVAAVAYLTIGVVLILSGGIAWLTARASTPIDRPAPEGPEPP